MADAPVTIRTLEPGGENAWDAYAAGHAGGALFHLTGWREVFTRALGHATHYLYAEQAGVVVGVLPLVHIRSRLFGDSLSSLAFCAHAGTLGDSAAVRDELERAAIDLAQRLGVGSLELRHRRPSGKRRPVKELYETFSKPIYADAEDNLQAIRGKQRNIIRKGIKNGLAARLDNVDNFYAVYAESVRNLGTPVYPRGLFAAIHREFPHNTEFFSAYKDERILSSSMLFYFRDEVCPYYWGGVNAARELKGNDFLFWEILCRAAARGCRVFDFGRSKRGTGAYQWKENLGFTPAQLYYEYELIRDRAMPDVNPLNPKYKLFVEAWKRLPLPVSNLIGPWLARSLG